jgi:hypothetical protein
VPTTASSGLQRRAVEGITLNVRRSCEEIVTIAWWFGRRERVDTSYDNEPVRRTYEAAGGTADDEAMLVYR